MPAKAREPKDIRQHIGPIRICSRRFPTEIAWRGRRRSCSRCASSIHFPRLLSAFTRTGPHILLCMDAVLAKLPLRSPASDVAKLQVESPASDAAKLQVGSPASDATPLLWVVLCTNPHVIGSLESVEQLPPQPIKVLQTCITSSVHLAPLGHDGSFTTMSMSTDGNAVTQSPRLVCRRWESSAVLLPPDPPAQSQKTGQTDMHLSKGKWTALVGDSIRAT